MKFFIPWLMGVAVAAAGLLGGPPAFAQPTYTVKIGHLESPLQPRHRFLEQIAVAVAERTAGDMVLEIYPSSQLGNQREMTEGVQFGTIEGTVAPAAFLGGFNPAVSILDIPFLMPADLDKAMRLRDGAFFQALLDSFDARGFVALTTWPNGRKDFTSSKPLTSLNDFRDQRFRVMDSRILITQFEGLGASAVVIPFSELYTALQTGVVDGEENPPDTIEKMRFYEVQDYMMRSGHGLMEDIVLFNKAWFDALPEEYRSLLRELFIEARGPFLTAKEADMDAAVETIREAGVTIVDLAAEQRATLRNAAFPPAKQAYLTQAGDEGAALLALYEQDYAAVMAE